MRIVLLPILALLALAQAPTAKDALNMQRASGAVISPDGRSVAYVLSRTDWDENAYGSDLYVADLATGKSLKLTASRKSVSAPQWSADSKRLAFTSDREGKQQVYIIPLAGGEAMQLSEHETAIGDIDWRDANWIYFVAPDAESPAAKDTKKKYGELTVVDEGHTMSHVWRIKVGDATKQKAERITEGDFHISSMAVSPDGKSLALATKLNPELSTLGAKLEIVDVSTKARRTLTKTRNSFGNLHWSPDAKDLAYTTVGEVENGFYANSHIEVNSLAGGEPRNITPDFDEQPQIVEWTGRGIVFTGRKKTASGVYLVNPKGGNLRVIDTGSGWNFAGVTLTRALDRAAFIGAPINGNAEVYVTPVLSWQPKALTDLKSQWATFKPANRQLVSWKSKDGALIEGVLLTPPNFDKSKKYPLLVVIHGGPTGIDLPTLAPDNTYPVEQFVAKGAVVLKPNYRGSAGYGEKFRALNVRNLGVGDAWDVLSGVDHLIAQGFVDEKHIGTMGWSQGGYISAFLATAHGDRFQAVSVGAGISNWVTYYVNTDIHPFTRQYLKATPWEDMEIYRKTSPMTYINTAKAPVLIQHGDNDKRVPPPNAFELYQGLKDRGVPARLVLYKGFGHGINHPKEAMHVMDENLKWFSKYVLGE